VIVDASRESDEPEIEPMSSSGGTKTVDDEPVTEPVWERPLCELVYVRIVRIEPVGEPVSERPEAETERSSASL
jgi:hypothetical protein